MRQKNSAGVNGGLSGGSSLGRTRSDDAIGASGILILLSYNLDFLRIMIFNLFRGVSLSRIRPASTLSLNHSPTNSLFSSFPSYKSIQECRSGITYSSCMLSRSCMSGWSCTLCRPCRSCRSSMSYRYVVSVQVMYVLQIVLACNTWLLDICLSVAMLP